MMQEILSRAWFMGQGCKRLEVNYHGRTVVRWAHPDGYFLNPQGRKIAHIFSPSTQRAALDPNRKTGKGYPGLRECCSQKCHIIMALAFYGPRPTFFDKNGKPYVGICHHLIPDAFDYRPANLLCYLTRPQHAEADRRQRALRKVLPDMHAISYERHRWLQDPRTTSREVFETELQALRIKYLILNS